MESWTVDRIRDFVATGAWSGSLPEPLCEQLLSMASVRRYAAGEVIYLQDDPPFGLALVLDDTVRFTRSTAAGRETLVHIGQPGFWFGELAVLIDSPTHVAVTASDAALVLVAPARSVQGMLALEPQFYAPLARPALERYGVLLAQLEQHRRPTPPARVATKLLMLAAVHAAGIGGDPACLSIKQSELAEMVALSRQTVNEILAGFARDALVELGIGSITLADRHGLASVAERDV